MRDVAEHGSLPEPNGHLSFVDLALVSVLPRLLQPPARFAPSLSKGDQEEVARVRHRRRAVFGLGLWVVPLLQEAQNGVHWHQLCRAGLSQRSSEEPSEVRPHGLHEHASRQRCAEKRSVTMMQVAEDPRCPRRSGPLVGAHLAARIPVCALPDEGPLQTVASLAQAVSAATLPRILRAQERAHLWFLLKEHLTSLITEKNPAPERDVL